MVRRRDHRPFSFVAHRLRILDGADVVVTAPQPRYFFPACRAHHAYCMAVDFGMKFCNSRGETLLLEAIIRDSQYERFYVHPGSVGLMEPQDLDILYRTNGYCQTVGVHIGIPKTLAQLAAGAVIIQRDGKPFFWPEEDAA
jgi:hypothetical protein